MIPARAAVPALLGVVVGMSILSAGDLSSYRGFQFGMTLAAGAKQAGSIASAARVIHQHPALIQELDWRPGSPLDSAKADPLQDGILSFYNGQLSRILVIYDRYKVEGMTVADMVKAMSATYGIASEPGADIAYHSNYGETAPVLARWEDAENSYNLIQTGNHSSFAMILYSKRLDALAQAANVESARLDALDAPQKALALEKLRDDEDRARLAKTRSVNLPNFRP
jgi:hypothetical protein